MLSHWNDLIKMFSLWMTTSQQTQRQSFLPILQLLTALCTRVIHVAVVLGRLSFIFSIFQLIRSFFLEIKRWQPSRRIFVHGFCSLFFIPEVEGCHSVFSQSVQFIFSHVLTSDKLEPFQRLLFTIINVSIEFVAHYETLRNKLQKLQTKILLVASVGPLEKKI